MSIHSPLGFGKYSWRTLSDLATGQVDFDKDLVLDQYLIEFIQYLISPINSVYQIPVCLDDQDDEWVNVLDSESFNNAIDFINYYYPSKDIYLPEISIIIQEGYVMWNVRGLEKKHAESINILFKGIVGTGYKLWEGYEHDIFPSLPPGEYRGKNKPIIHWEDTPKNDMLKNLSNNSRQFVRLLPSVGYIKWLLKKGIDNIDHNYLASINGQKFEVFERFEVHELGLGVFKYKPVYSEHVVEIPEDLL